MNSYDEFELWEPSDEYKKKLCIRNEITDEICNFISKNNEKSKYILVYGSSGFGKKTTVKRTISLLNKNIININLKKCCFNDDEEFMIPLNAALKQVLLQNSYLCIEGFEILENDKNKERYIEFIVENSQKFSNTVFFLSCKKMSLENYILDKDYLFKKVELNELNKIENLKLWTKYLENLKDFVGIAPEEIANNFTFTPKQIVQTVKLAKNLACNFKNKRISKKELFECAYEQMDNSFSNNAKLIPSNHSWNDLVLDNSEKKMLKNICDQVKLKHIVYEKWDFKKRILYGNGISMLFEGLPGTGKTMAAQIIANELNLRLYRVDLSQIVSKYIGETEKNLGTIFDEAKKANVILLFDEADALFGKRTQVKDSHDKNANFETSYLLQKMEEYTGISILTTNFLENIDKAFFRRINYVVHFAFPNKTVRKEIWEGMFPKKMPIANIDFDYLAQKFEISGGTIKNVVLNSAFLAAKNSKRVELKHILVSLKNELKKQGKMPMKSDFAEYSYLLNE